MQIHPMAARLRDLGLAAMANAFLDMHNQSAVDDLSREDWLGLLIDREVTARDNKRLGRRLSVARLRQNSVVEDADLRTPRGLDRSLFQSLATCGWVRESQHLLIGGQPGPENHGSPVLLAIKPAVRGSRCSTDERRGCSPSSPLRVARGGWRA